jgi:hypothetical protein
MLNHHKNHTLSKLFFRFAKRFIRGTRPTIYKKLVMTRRKYKHAPGAAFIRHGAWAGAARAYKVGNQK